MTATYRSWLNMRGRCNNPASRHYPRYGGRGIQVCRRWDDYSVFLSDMGERPAGKTLERKKNSKGYNKGNCLWASREEQSNNRECSVLREAYGELKSLAQWARDPRCKVRYGTLRKRVASRWPVELAMTWLAKRWPKGEEKIG